MVAKVFCLFDEVLWNNKCLYLISGLSFLKNLFSGDYNYFSVNEIFIDVIGDVS